MPAAEIPRPSPRRLGVRLAVATAFASAAAVALLAGTLRILSDGEAGVRGAPLAGSDLARAPGLTNRNALMLAARAGSTLIGVEAATRTVRVLVVPPDVRELPRSRVRVRLRQSTRVRQVAAPCGWNCFELERAGVMRGDPVRLEVEVRTTSGTSAATLSLPARMPRAGAALYARVVRRMNQVRTVRVREQLSNGTATLDATWLYQAPDRASYVSSDGARGVIIGDRRWDYLDGRWTPQPAAPLRSPSYTWAGAARPRITGTATRAGRRVSVLTLFKPNGTYPAFFRLYVDNAARVVEARMTAPAHFMTDRFDRFDAPIRIRPPV